MRCAVTAADVETIALATQSRIYPWSCLLSSATATCKGYAPNSQLEHDLGVGNVVLFPSTDHQDEAGIYLGRFVSRVTCGWSHRVEILAQYVASPRVNDIVHGRKGIPIVDIRQYHKPSFDGKGIVANLRKGPIQSGYLSVRQEQYRNLAMIIIALLF
jgi:hypothetical protein